MPPPKVPIHSRPSLSSANEVMLRSVKPSSLLARDSGRTTRCADSTWRGRRTWCRSTASRRGPRTARRCSRRAASALRAGRGDSSRKFRWRRRTRPEPWIRPTHSRPWLSMSSDCTRLSGRRGGAAWRLRDTRASDRCADRNGRGRRRCPPRPCRRPIRSARARAAAGRAGASSGGQRDAR